MEDITVILLTYNSTFERILLSLKSIIYQKNVNFELIVSDDNSEIDHFDLIEKFLVDNCFNNYRLIKNCENNGIIGNLLFASKVAKAKYIKHLGQGDMFYDEYSLSRIYDEMYNNDATALFSDAIYYYLENNKFVTCSVRSYPQLLRAYLNNNKYSIKRNYLVYDDNILGAAISYKTEKLIEYLTMICKKTKMYEDNIIRLMVFYEEKILYTKKPTLLYEYGMGHSTSNNSEYESVYEYELGIINSLILKLCQQKDDKLSKQIVIHINYERKTSYSIIDKIKYYFSIPSFLFYRLLVEYFPRKTCTYYNQDFVRKCIEND